MTDKLISVSNLSNVFTVDKPWDLIKEYPEEAWKVLKELHDENVQLKTKLSTYSKVVTNLTTVIQKAL